MDGCTGAGSRLLARGPDAMTEEALPTSHEWVRWLSGVDAAVLLLHLCQHIAIPHVTKDALVTLVHAWRAHALRALTAADWKASVDTY